MAAAGSERRQVSHAKIDETQVSQLPRAVVESDARSQGFFRIPQGIKGVMRVALKDMPGAFVTVGIVELGGIDGRLVSPNLSPDNGTLESGRAALIFKPDSNERRRKLGNLRKAGKNRDYKHVGKHVDAIEEEDRAQARLHADRNRLLLVRCSVDPRTVTQVEFRTRVAKRQPSMQ